MSDLPRKPSLDHLRREAKLLLRAAGAGETEARRRIGARSDPLNLAAAQLAIAREYGFASWPRLKAEVEARTLDLAAKADAFCQASVADWTGKAARLLAETPDLAGYSFATAVVLGDAARVRAELAGDPGLATRREGRFGWTALHAVSGSRWHWLDPSRAEGLVTVATLLLDAGADPNDIGGRGQTALRCATGSASAGVGNAPLIRLLLDRGAIPDDDDLYLAAFAENGHRCLQLLLEHIENVAAVAEHALAAPISGRDVEGVRLLLDAGADPRRYRSDDGAACSVVYEAISHGGPAELVELLIAHGADPSSPGLDGRSPLQLAIAHGKPDLAELLLRHGARDDTTATERFLAACLRADENGARHHLTADPALRGRLGQVMGEAIVQAAEAGNLAAVQLMLDLGFPIESPANSDGGTVLHAAAYAGSVEIVRFLLSRGADVEARDGQWRSTSLEWAIIGSGQRHRSDSGANWVDTVRALLDAGASTDAVSLSPDDPKPPSPQVAQLLRERGVDHGSAGVHTS